MTTLSEIVSTQILPRVSQPAQYIGREINQLVKDGDWENARLRLVLAFPDTYSIGISHLGSQILYSIANDLPGICAERTYCPWIDAEAIMRDHDIPLFTWDTRQRVADADILGISLQYELSYTNILNLLDLAGIPLHAADRTESHPLVIGGGPQDDSPEPLAPFIDAFVIGDAEEALPQLLDVVAEMKEAGESRFSILKSLSMRFEWLYVPGLYEPQYNEDGTLAELKPLHDGVRTGIRRAVVRDFETTPAPTKLLIPHIQAVHERIAIEVMRGCPNGCYFCHAGHTKRPARWRSVERILDIAEQTWKATGFDEISLLSLSTSDHPALPELAKAIEERFSPRHVNISVPSLRVDRMLQDVPCMVNSVRKGGLTLAVEAARDDMRKAINKKVTDGDLFDGVRAAYRAGWRSVKLYFMAGFPGERPEDIDGIFELARKVSNARKEINGYSAGVNATVSWFVPKPHTPMQWAPQATAEYFYEVADRLRSLGRRTTIKFRISKPHRSILEAVFARGDRRLSKVIETAWKKGARFDGWDECFNNDIWDQSFAECKLDPAWYAHRERGRDEVLPWGHIEAGPLSHEGLWKQYEKMRALLS